MNNNNSTLPEPIKIQLISLIGQNLTVDEIDALGRQIDPKFKAHLLSGEPFGITLRPEQAARTLVKHFGEKQALSRVLTLLVHIHSFQDPSIIGRTASLDGVETLLQTLGTAGLRFDPTTGVLSKVADDESVNWGFLKEGEVYHFCHLSVDIAGNSELQLKYPKSEVEVVYNNFYTMLKKTIKNYNGQIWNWAGDGGIISFYLGDKVQDAIFCAIQIQLQLAVFNLSRSSNRFDEPLRLRIAAHDGLTTYKGNKGTILSEAINFVAHLEKNGTETNSISISKSIYNNLPNRLQSIFKPKGIFENIEIFNTSTEIVWNAEK